MKKEYNDISMEMLDLYDGNAIFGFSKIAMKCGLGNTSNVYHYTDIGGFISIMQNRELWASHIYFMNDKSEYHHGKEMYQSTLEKLAENSTDELEKQLYLMVNNSLDNSISEGFFPVSIRILFQQNVRS